ncbi:MAG: radical SAM protein [Dehalococcoidia bacterium]|nr:MAG: radical SAM protein [Dehalococcoidia bacterium]
MRTLLINPPTPQFIVNKEYYIPSSLLYLAAALQKAGKNVKILDLNTYEAEYSDTSRAFFEKIMISYIHDYQPSLIGIGCLFCGQFPAVLSFSKKIKEESKEIKIAIGGIHPTTYPTEILANCPSIDFVALGEGEITMVELVDSLESGREDFNKIDGIAYRSNGEIIVNQKISFIENLDELPFPAYDLINLEDYYHDTSHWHNPKNLPINASIPIISSRSCPNRCNFCSMFMVMGPRWRYRSPENVVDEIEYLYNKYNHQHFSFMDDNITLNKARTLEMCNQIVKRRLNIQFEIPNGLSIRTLDKDVLDALISAGLVRVALGIESGSDYIRNEIIGKRLSREKIFEVVRLTKEYKQLYVKAFFIIGMPEDTRETLMDTYNMIKEIDIDMPQVFNLLPFPGTKVFEQALKDNLLIDIDNLWKKDVFYGSGNKQFFVKPYELEVEDLQEFRDKFDNLIATLMARKREEKKRVRT